MAKPKITTKCPANHYSGPRETIAEFSTVIAGRLKGGLLALRVADDDTLQVSVYNTDPGVVVTGGKDTEADLTEDLIAAARGVLASWEGNGLAEAVRFLNAAIENLDGHKQGLTDV